MDRSAAAPAPGAATIRADRLRVKRPLPAVNDTGFGTMPGTGAALAAGRAAAGLADSAKAIAGAPMTNAADAASQPPRLASLAGRKNFLFTLPALDAVRASRDPTTPRLDKFPNSQE